MIVGAQRPSVIVVGTSFGSLFVATITASLAAEASANKGDQNTGTILNAKMADPDQPLAARRITQAEHKCPRARFLAQL